MSKLKERLAAKIRDAYYDARNNGGTMDSASYDAADAVLRILDGVEENHIVEFVDDGYIVQHPLIERANGSLFHCEFHAYVAEWGGDRELGRYRVVYVGHDPVSSSYGADIYEWERL